MLPFSLSCILATSLFYVNKPVVTVREEPFDGSKILVSQIIFGETIEIENELENWAYIITSDEYCGWITKNSYVNRDSPYITSLKVSRLAAHVYEQPNVQFGPVLTLPYGSQLQKLYETDERWLKVVLPCGKECFIQKGDVALEAKLHDKNDLIDFSKKFLGLPYTWGGRSSFGYDCSGFVQMLYDQIDIHLLSESKKQCRDPRFQLICIDELEAGDLIFFGKCEENIAHVGMYLGSNQFIHAVVRENKPWIRISDLTDFEWSGHRKAFYPYRTARQLIKSRL